jgi:hypothetical protein
MAKSVLERIIHHLHILEIASENCRFKNSSTKPIKEAKTNYPQLKTFKINFNVNQN